MNDWKQEELGLIQWVNDAWHLPQRSIYNPLRSRREIDLYMCFLERSVICYLFPSRPEKNWAGRVDTSMTDLEKVTDLVTSVLQKQTTTKAKTLDTRLSLEKKCHPSEKCHHFCHPIFRGIRSLQWLHRRSWGKQKKSTNRRLIICKRYWFKYWFSKVQVQWWNLWSESVSLFFNPATEFYL